MEHRPQRLTLLHPLQPHRGQAQMVGTEGRAGGKDPHAAIAPQTGRPHRRGPVLPDGFGELPDEPEMGEILQPPDGVRIPVGRFKDDAAPQLWHQPALAWHAELLRQLRMDAGDDLQSVHHSSLRPVSVRWDRMSLGRRLRRRACPATISRMPAASGMALRK